MHDQESGLPPGKPKLRPEEQALKNLKRKSRQHPHANGDRSDRRGHLDALLEKIHESEMDEHRPPRR